MPNISISALSFVTLWFSFDSAWSSFRCTAHWETVGGAFGGSEDAVSGEVRKTAGSGMAGSSSLDVEGGKEGAVAGDRLCFISADREYVIVVCGS